MPKTLLNLNTQGHHPSVGTRSEWLTFQSLLFVLMCSAWCALHENMWSGLLSCLIYLGVTTLHLGFTWGQTLHLWSGVSPEWGAGRTCCFNHHTSAVFCQCSAPDYVLSEFLHSLHPLPLVIFSIASLRLTVTPATTTLNILKIIMLQCAAEVQLKPQRVHAYVRLYRYAFK